MAEVRNNPFATDDAFTANCALTEAFSKGLGQHVQCGGTITVHEIFMKAVARKTYNRRIWFAKFAANLLDHLES